MKCDRCSKPATIHITEIVEDSYLEHHLCEEHAKQQLSSDNESETEQVGAASGAKLVPVEGKLPAELEKLSCPLCGMSFREFRGSGRLGCSHDYEVFREELLQLLENIHGETRHGGKTPKRVPKDSRKHAELLQLRQSLRKAVAEESYEEAAKLRDQIQELEAQEDSP